MRRFVEGIDRGQATLFPECLEDWIGEDNPVRVVDVFVEELDLAELGFGGVEPEATGRPSYHPSILLKLYIYGYLNRVQSSRRLGYEAGRNVEDGVEFARITSGCRPTNSFAQIRIRSALTPAQNTSMRRLWPFAQPNSASSCVNSESKSFATESFSS